MDNKHVDALVQKRVSGLLRCVEYINITNQLIHAAKAYKKDLTMA
jgi:hypothetical protein